MAADIEVLAMPVEATKQTSSEPVNPFTYAFLHSFGCGVASGGINEFFESLERFAELRQSLGLDALLTSLPNRELFKVHWSEDHVIAFSVFLAVYVLDAWALYTFAQPKQPPALAGFASPDAVAVRSAFAERNATVAATAAPSRALPTDKPGSASKAKVNRRRYLTKTWYAAALSPDLKPNKPLAVELCDEELVLFRGDDGQAYCTSAICPHRGAPLGMGWIKNCNAPCGATRPAVVCPYHGWAFDGSGRLLEVPAEGEFATLPRRPLLSNHPVVERGGFVWVFYDPSQDESVRADPPVDEVPMISELLAAHTPSGVEPASGERWTAVHGSFEFEADHMSVFENAIDVSHIHFLHSDSFGNASAPSVRGMDVTTVGNTAVQARFQLTNKSQPYFATFQKLLSLDADAKAAVSKSSGGEDINITAIAMLPCTSVIAFELTGGLKMITFVSTVPLTAGTSMNRFALIRNFAHAPQLDDFVRRSMEKILTQDKAVVEKLRVDLMDREVSVRSDLPQVAFRKLRHNHIARGPGFSTDADLHPSLRRYEAMAEQDEYSI